MISTGDAFDTGKALQGEAIQHDDQVRGVFILTIKLR